MNKSLLGALFGALLSLSSCEPALAASMCSDISAPKEAVASHHGRWIELTNDQWQFLRGVYAMNPATPPGLPYGDRAILAQIDGYKGGLVFFIDGDKACTPMLAPDALLSMMRDVVTGEISHEGTSN